MEITKLNKFLYCFIKEHVSDYSSFEELILGGSNTWSIILGTERNFLGIVIDNYQEYIIEPHLYTNDFDNFKYHLKKRGIDISNEILESISNNICKSLFQDEKKFSVSNDKLTAFLYDLMRDHLTCGVVEKLVQVAQLGDGNVEYTNQHLAKYSQELANRLRN